MRVSVYHTDDWSALFVDGKKVFEHHEVRLLELQKYCPEVKVGDITERWLDSAPLWSYLNENGSFPETESDLREYV